MRRRISIRGRVRPSVRPSVGPSVRPVLFSKGKRTHAGRIFKGRVLKDLVFFSQNLYFKLGIENKKTVFLFGDQHVMEEGFLELINNMLTSGMVPALYADDEKENIISQVSSGDGRALRVDREGEEEEKKK